MIEADIVQEWKAQAREAGILKGRCEQQIAIIMRIMKSRAWAIPDEVASAIKASTDLAQLDRWFDTALAAGSMATFRQQAGL